MREQVLSGILGFVVGDALGVPVEFQSREELKAVPVVSMRSDGSHGQPKGTWSDDSSMTLCLMASLTLGLDYNDICTRFLNWAENGYMTAHGQMFDIGRTTLTAIRNFSGEKSPLECGGFGEYDNGNGSLMRILPLAFYTLGMKPKERFEIVHNVSKLTHSHERSLIACSIYVQLACELLKGYSKEKAYRRMIDEIKSFYQEEAQLASFQRILNGTIAELSEPQISSSGYVVDTLEAAIWCFLTTDTYTDCVLKAVNLGDDTDTVAAVAGGLAGFLNIANQNARKLGISDLMNVSESRLSMQHLKIYQNRKANHSYEQLIPLTPATSFSMTSGCGNQEERALMYAHIKRLPEFKNLGNRLSEFFAYDAEKWWERYYVGRYEALVTECNDSTNNYIAEMSAELSKRLASADGLIQSIIQNCTSKSSTRKRDSRPLINELRKIFAQISLDKLEPDLVIMDEFQRFRDLIAPSDDEQGMLCRAFLQDTKTKVLLLSATPYKPYSTLEELVADNPTDHYKEFMEVMKFLFYDAAKREAFEKVWQDYSNALCEVSKDNLTVLIARKNTSEEVLYQGICRTERFSSGIIDDSGATETEISEGDILSYHAMQTLLDDISNNSKRPLRYRNTPMEYVKSSPYLLSFMESYQLKKQITDYFSSGLHMEMVKGSNSKYLLLKKSAIHSYTAIPANNARLAKLRDIVFDGGKNSAENLLWIPASKTYYCTGSVFDKNKNYSKVLVFSSWEMVPRMVSVMLSYEAERLTIGKLFHNAKLTTLFALRKHT